MTRKWTSLVLAMLLVLSVFSAIPALAESISTRVTTTNPGDTLRVRKGPHKGDTPTVDYVTNKQAITLISWDDDEDPEAWAKIKVKSSGAVGYLKTKYIAYFGLDNSDGELDPNEDDDIDWRDADDNDGHGGSGSSGSSSSASGFGRVSSNGGSVNVRNSASTGARVLGTARNGERLDILSKSGSWYRVRTDRGLRGYIYSTYVAEGAYATTTASVNFRKGAGTGYSVIRTLSSGTRVVVYYNNGNWSRVRVGSTYGYIYKSYYEFD